jgi:16S rRNA (guanine527-N7)-methyltransferase
VLDAGLPRIPLQVDPAVRDAIAAHVRLLLAWNMAINLTAITDPEAVARLHVLDSLVAVPLLRDRAARGRAGAVARLRIADIGSGGGFPGIPIAAAMPAAQVVLVDSVAKKVRFLETAADATGLAGGLGGGRVAARAIRAEDLAAEVRSGEVAPFDVVTARAVGSLADLVEVAFPLLAIGGALVAWKRGEIADEVTEARRAAATLGRGTIGSHEVTVAGLEGHRLVVVEKRGPTPAGYPRDPGRRARSRW